MSKTKQKEKSEMEHLRGRIKRLQSQNRQLRKRNRELERKAHFFENIVDDVVEESDVTEVICPKCKSGVLQLLDLHHISLISCTACDYKEKQK